MTSTPHEPWLHEGAPEAPAVLMLHGFTGVPGSLTPLARELADTGATVSVPLLPGHGGRWQELARTRWEDWLEAAVDEYDRLCSRHGRVVVAGMSMGGALACALGVGRAPSAMVLVNPALYVDSPFAPLLPMLSRVLPSIPAIGGDIARPGMDEHANDRTPLVPLATFHTALRDLRERLWAIGCPVTLCLSGRDAVVAPRSFRVLRSRLTAPLTTVSLRRSHHVATLDYDAGSIAHALRAALEVPAPAEERPR